MVWLLTPLSGDATHNISSQAAWHGRLMVLAWGFILPVGVLVARFFKVTPRQDWPLVLDNKFWWHAHRALQYSGVAVMSLGVWMIWNAGVASAASQLAIWHGYGGWSLIALGWLQIFGAHLRGTKGGPTDSQMRGDHFDMTLHRLVFEWAHKILGYATLAGAAVGLACGLALVDAPRWMALGGLVWIVFLICFFVVMERRGYVKTYPAIWGKEFQ